MLLSIRDKDRQVAVPNQYQLFCAEVGDVSPDDIRCRVRVQEVSLKP
jgi:hypothetical protein